MLNSVLILLSGEPDLQQNHDLSDPHWDLDCVGSLQCGSCLHLLIIHSVLVTCPFSLNLQLGSQTPFREISERDDTR